MTENVETRVGYVTLTILRDVLRECVEEKTIEGKYNGDLNLYYNYLTLCHILSHE